MAAIPTVTLHQSLLQLSKNLGFLILVNVAIGLLLVSEQYMISLCIKKIRYWSSVVEVMYEYIRGYIFETPCTCACLMIRRRFWEGTILRVLISCFLFYPRNKFCLVLGEMPSSAPLATLLVSYIVVKYHVSSWNVALHCVLICCITSEVM